MFGLRCAQGLVKQGVQQRIVLRFKLRGQCFRLTVEAGLQLCDLLLAFAARLLLDLGDRVTRLMLLRLRNGGSLFPGILDHPAAF